MPQGSSVVLVGSIADAIGTKGYGTYNASKAAVRSLARTWAQRACPARHPSQRRSTGPDRYRHVCRRLRRSARDADRPYPTRPHGARGGGCSAAALFLANDESSFITGAELLVDGGMTQV